MNGRFQVNCAQCGQFISKEDVYSGDLPQEDVSDGIEYGPPHYAVTCRKCMKKETEPEKPTIDFCDFMYGLIYAEYKKTDCHKCYGLGAIGDMCCDGRECGCRGMPTDFSPCDCGVEFPSDTQILEWSKSHVSKQESKL